MNLENTIESVLFYQAEPLSVKRLGDLLKKNEEEILAALVRLEERLSTTGIRLLRNGNNVTLGTSPESGALIEAMTKEELSRDLSKASLETLAIVLYKSPITRAEIDYIRGVNSTFILRNLLIRGLVEKIDNPNDQRSFLYKPTFTLLEHMGLTKMTDLPEYEETMRALDQFVVQKEEEKTEETKEVVQSGESTAEEEVEIEADILEEDDAGMNYDDEELHERHYKDEVNKTI